MEQYLIDKLWEHTDKVDKENEKKAKTGAKEREQVNRPRLLPASHFFHNTSASLFMSFHHESANSMKHYHDFFELIYVCKGSPVGVINDRELRLHEGNLCIMNPNAVHYFKKYSEEKDLILNIVLPKDIFQKSIFRILLGDPVLNAFFIRYRLENEKQPSFLYLEHLDKDTDCLLEMLLKEYLDKKQYSQVIIESLLTLIFSFILRNYNEKSSRGGDTVTEIINYIYLNYQDVNIKTLAVQFNYHPKYLSFLIHRHTAQTFRELLVNIKMQNALDYLVYTDHSIENIALLVGYKDKSSFYNIFKKEFKISPAAYRKQFSYCSE